MAIKPKGLGRKEGKFTIKRDYPDTTFGDTQTLYLRSRGLVMSDGVVKKDPALTAAEEDGWETVDDGEE